MQDMQAKRRLDYRPSDFTITHLGLDFSLEESATRVVATSKVVRQAAGATTLELDGEALSLVAVAINGVVADHQELEQSVAGNVV